MNKKIKPNEVYSNAPLSVQQDTRHRARSVSVAPTHQNLTEVSVRTFHCEIYYAMLEPNQAISLAKNLLEAVGCDAVITPQKNFYSGSWDVYWKNYEARHIQNIEEINETLATKKNINK